MQNEEGNLQEKHKIVEEKRPELGDINEVRVIVTSSKSCTNSEIIEVPPGYGFYWKRTWDDRGNSPGKWYITPEFGGEWWCPEGGADPWSGLCAPKERYGSMVVRWVNFQGHTSATDKKRAYETRFDESRGGEDWFFNDGKTINT